AFAEGSLRESFEGSFPPEGWSKAPSTWAQSSSQHYDGAKSAYYYPFAVASDVKLITPQLTIATGNTFKYYGRTSSGTTQSIQIEYSSDLVSWTNIGSSNTLTTTWTEYTVDLSSIAGNNYYLAIAATTTNSSGGSFYVDYVRGPVIYVAPPQPATIGAPANAASKVNINTTLTWSAGATGGTPQGYKLYFGTDGGGTVAPTNIENGTVQTSPYTPAAPLTFGTTYYWQVVPFNSGGDATGCPIWSFSTMTGQAGLWNGTISNDWANVSNWDNAQLPVASTDVIIQAGLTNYPTLSAAGTCHNLTMEPGTSLLGNTNLTVTGNSQCPTHHRRSFSR
ncbi:MAG TPA: choice-of-anchor J domain-containing protein, partial [Bacteroidales bacterium]|nr:choice-of-anchor J domain-containing protein [Bacteroidales bacterium]